MWIYYYTTMCTRMCCSPRSKPACWPTFLVLYTVLLHPMPHGAVPGYLGQVGNLVGNSRKTNTCTSHRHTCGHSPAPPPHAAPMSKVLRNSSSVKAKARAASKCSFWRLSTSTSWRRGGGRGAADQRAAPHLLRPPPLPPPHLPPKHATHVRLPLAPSSLHLCPRPCPP